MFSEENSDIGITHHKDVKCVVENGTARLELVKWDPNIVWNSPTLPDLSKTRASELREEALLWRHDFEKELAREKIVRARLLERKAISDSLDQVCAITDILPLNDILSWGLKSDGRVHSVAEDCHMSN